jgi:hypothetical protein
MTIQPTPAGTAHAATNVESNPSNNRVDAFTDFINEWIDTNVKVFTRKEK